jgi:hypothetical protein
MAGFSMNIKDHPNAELPRFRELLKARFDSFQSYVIANMVGNYRLSGFMQSGLWRLLSSELRSFVSAAHAQALVEIYCGGEVCSQS